MLPSLNQIKKAYLSGKATIDADLELLRIGAEFQAEIPRLKSLKLCDLIETDDDKILWSPGMLPEDEVADYLHSIRMLGRKGLNEEKALSLLHSSNYDIKKALKRFDLLPNAPHSTIVWTPSECEIFEFGIGKFGKDFSSIQKMVQTKNIHEIVEFYYFWKKTERHDDFLKNKLALIRGRSQFKRKQKKKMCRVTDFAELFDQQDFGYQVQTRSRSQLLCTN